MSSRPIPQEEIAGSVSICPPSDSSKYHLGSALSQDQCSTWLLVPRATTSIRPSPHETALGPPPMTPFGINSHGPQPIPLYQRCHSPPSEPLANRSKRPLPQEARSGSPVIPPGGAPSDSSKYHFGSALSQDQCSTWLLVPRATTSILPLPQETAPGPPASFPPDP